MIHFTEQGTGLPVLFLHGFCESEKLWEGVSQSLSHHFRVLTPDLPGHGASHLPLDINSLKDVSKHLWNWLDDLDVVDCAIIGHSLGGYIALEMLAQRPEHVTGLGLFHSTALADSEEKKINRNKAINFIGRNGDAGFKKNFIPSLFHRDCDWLPNLTEMVNGTAAETIISYTGWMRDRPSHLELLKKNKLPVLIIAGFYDEFIRVKSLEEQSEVITNVTFCVLSDSGHLGMWEEPMEAQLVLQDWLESIH